MNQRILAQLVVMAPLHRGCYRDVALNETHSDNYLRVINRQWTLETAQQLQRAVQGAIQHL